MAHGLTLILVILTVLGNGRAAVAGAPHSPRDVNVSWDTLWGRVDLKVSGEVELTADDSDVARLSPGKSLVVGDKGWFNTRRLQIDAEPSGVLRRRFTLNSHEHPFDESAARWFRGLMPQLVARGGLAAESRARRLFASGGMDALRAEMSRLASDHVKAVYVREFIVLAGANLNGSAADRIADAVDQISSDAAKGEILQAMLDRVAENQSYLEVYIRVVGSMDSSLEQANALSALLQKTPTDRVCLKVLPAVRHVSSAAAATTVLELAAQHCAITPKFVTAYLDAVSELSSSAGQTQALATLIDTRRVAPQQMDAVRDFSQNQVSSRVGRTMLAQKIAAQQHPNR